MASSGMLHHVALARTDVLEELSVSIISVFVFFFSMRQLLVMASTSDTSVFTRATWRNIPENIILDM
jgi:hypothetical protein